MNETFKNLDESKQYRILNAALQEFAENGYAQASTNKIIKSAGIGKGMLFHYFNNKKDLYEYLIDYAINVMQYEYFILIDINESDFIERMKQIARIKADYLAKHPYVGYFIGTVLVNNKESMPAELEIRLEHLRKTGNEILYKNIDKTLFRDDVDVEKAFRLIRWAIEGYQNELIQQFKGKKLSHVDLQPYWDEFYEYMDVLKTSFYRGREDAK